MPRKIGKLKPRSNLPLDVFDVQQAAKLIAEKLLWVQKGEVKHRREGLRIPGNLGDHMDSAAHHLALATCQHVGSPCTFCLAWADLEVLSLALEKRDEDVLNQGTSRVIRNATERISRLAGDSIGTDSKHSTSSRVKRKSVAKGGSARQKNSKSSDKRPAAKRKTGRPDSRGEDDKQSKKSGGRTKDSTGTASKSGNVRTSTAKRAKSKGPGRKKKVSKRVAKDG